MEKDNVKVAGETYLSQPINAVVVAFTRWRQTNLGTTIKLILLTIILASVLGGIFFALAGSSAHSNGLFEANVRIQQFADWAFSTGWVYLLGLIVALVVVCLPFGIASDYSMVTAQNLRKVGVKESLTRGYKRFGVGIATYLLAALFVILGLVVLIIPGIYIALRLSYINSLVANENHGPMDTIRRSWALTKGNLWDIIGAVSVGNIAVTLVGLLITLVTINSTSLGDGLAFILSLLSVVVSLITAQVYYFRYHQSALEKADELKKEGTDKLNYILFATMLLISVIDSNSPNQMNLNVPTNVNET